MKKIFLFIFVLFISFSLTACENMDGLLNGILGNESLTLPDGEKDDDKDDDDDDKDEDDDNSATKEDLEKALILLNSFDFEVAKKQINAAIEEGIKIVPDFFNELPNYQVKVESESQGKIHKKEFLFNRTDEYLYAQDLVFNTLNYLKVSDLKQIRDELLAQFELEFNNDYLTTIFDKLSTPDFNLNNLNFKFNFKASDFKKEDGEFRLNRKVLEEFLIETIMSNGFISDAHSREAVETYFKNNLKDCYLRLEFRNGFIFGYEFKVVFKSRGNGSKETHAYEIEYDLEDGIEIAFEDEVREGSILETSRIYFDKEGLSIDKKDGEGRRYQVNLNPEKMEGFYRNTVHNALEFEAKVLKTKHGYSLSIVDPKEQVMNVAKYTMTLTETKEMVDTTLKMVNINANLRRLVGLPAPEFDFGPFINEALTVFKSKLMGGEIKSDNLTIAFDLDNFVFRVSGNAALDGIIDHAEFIEAIPELAKSPCVFRITINPDGTLCEVIANCDGVDEVIVSYK